jgi:hypothetical protein
MATILLAMRQVIFFNSRAAQFRIRDVSGSIVLAIALASCSSAAPPLAIRMYNPKTNQTLHCTARSESSAHSPVLANAVEACARQLEASGFVRDK